MKLTSLKIFLVSSKLNCVIGANEYAVWNCEIPYIQIPILQTNSHTSSIHVDLAPIVRKVDNVIHRINLSSPDSTVGFPNTYPLDSDISGWIVQSVF